MPIKQWDSLEDFRVEEFSHGGYTYPVFRQGEGPAIVVIHEVPGITPEVARFARRLVEAGFSVLMPSLFGTPGKRFSLAYAAQQMAASCIRREFSVLSAHRASPVTDFLRGLARAAHEETGGPVGAIGMCLTGNFALTLAMDPWLMAPVLSQPSLPVGPAPALRRGLHASPAVVATLQRRVEEEGVRVLGLRFTADPLCPAARFRELERQLGDGFEAIEINSKPGNPDGIPITAHSVVTTDLVDREGHPTHQALERVISFFRQQLA
ncbi:MAG: dienelactone hydrolase [Gammaproteobacteria bacterium HGW-Gammaproteobacteria-14]|nr:MAG: dienelactone hydrolase [Gammaproteobacteria bacterium HGW-Gammaproteobacteria-14]